MGFINQLISWAPQILGKLSRSFPCGRSEVIAIVTGRLVPCRPNQLAELDVAVGRELEPGAGANVGGTARESQGEIPGEIWARWENHRKM
jgi:hypothetical protein